MPIGQNRSYYSDPYVDQQFEKTRTGIDAAEREAIYKELGLKILDECIAIRFGWADKYNYWWPWVKNYYGESYQFMHDPPYELMWLDQDLKAEMGY